MEVSVELVAGTILERIGKIKFLDLFAGIGLFRMGFEMAGFECIGHCEIDKYANLSYNAMHRPREDEWFEEDITKISAKDLPTCSVWIGGFPCQDLSVASNTRNGLLGKRSGLFFEIVRLLSEQDIDTRPLSIFAFGKNALRAPISFGF